MDYKGVFLPPRRRLAGWHWQLVASVVQQQEACSVATDCASDLKHLNKRRIISLDIPDDCDFMDDELSRLLEHGVA